MEPQTNVGVYATEPANIRMHANGRVDVFIGSGAHGQGLETTTAQLVAENLGVDYADVTVRQGDTESAPFGPGTGGSRSGPMIGQAVTEASLSCATRSSPSPRTCSKRHPTTSRSPRASCR